MAARFHLGTPSSTSGPGTPRPHTPVVHDYSPYSGRSRTSSFNSSDADDLPYPADLSRKDFLAESFNPSLYLSSLRNRHQTLEDLRTDLRKRSQLLNQELLDLVNENYEDFLTLGRDLKGGGEAVEGVRVGLLGFEREIEGLRDVVAERMREVRKLLEERKQAWKGIVTGRALLEWERSLQGMETGLGIRDSENENDEDDFDDDIDDDDDSDEITDPALRQLAITTKRLRRHTQEYLLLSHQADRLGSEHPFIQAQKSRVDAIRRTLLLDLSATVKTSRRIEAKEQTLELMRLYAELGSESEGLKALKGA